MKCTDKNTCQEWLHLHTWFKLCSDLYSETLNKSEISSLFNVSVLASPKNEKRENWELSLHDYTTIVI